MVGTSNYSTLIDISETFGSFLCAILVTEQPTKSKKPLFRNQKPGDYAFRGLTALQVLEAQEDLTTDQAKEILQVFVEAHLLHQPGDCTSKRIKKVETTSFQPTAKGFAFLQKWFYVQGAFVDDATVQSVSPILESDHNTMEMVELERALLNRKIQVSTGVAILLWSRMMGESPSIYDLSKLEVTPALEAVSDDQADGYRSSISLNIVASHGRAQRSADIFNPNMLASNNLFGGLIENDRDLPGETSLHRIIPTRNELTLKEVISPYYQRAMMHPNSQNAMQYWDSRGIRVFKNVRFERTAKRKLSGIHSYSVNFVLTGHAMLQWIMDCTTVESYAEGKSLARLLIKNNFVERIVDSVADATAAPRVTNDYTAGSDLSPTAFYRLTDRGRRACQWGHTIPSPSFVSMDSFGDLSWSTSRDKKMEQKTDKLVTIVSALDEKIASSSPQDSDLCSENGTQLSNAEDKTNKTPFGLDALTDMDPLAGIWDLNSKEVGEKFLQGVNFSIISKEPALKMLFRQDAARYQCFESLLCVDATQQLLLLLSAYHDAQRTITRRDALQTEIEARLDQLRRVFVSRNSVLEVNMSANMRRTILRGIEFDDSKEQAVIIEQTLRRLKGVATTLLLDTVARFVNGDRPKQVPGLREYVISRYVLS